MGNVSLRSGTTTIPLSYQCIGQVLDDTAARFPDHPALVTCEQRTRYTYRQLLQETERVARGLLALGVRKGDRVGIWAANCAEWVLVQFATAKLGAVLVNINPSFQGRELRQTLHHSGCGTLIMMSGFRDLDYLQIFHSICPESRDHEPGALKSKDLPTLRNVILVGDATPTHMMIFSDLQRKAEDVTLRELRLVEEGLDSQEPINIQYTSGTTGAPKGACLTHHNIVNNAMFVGTCMKVSNADKVCIPVPFYHCFGMVLGNMCCVTVGATMVVPGGAFDPLAVLQAVEREQCTVLYGVPTMFIAQLERLEHETFDTSTLRTGIMSGSYCPLELMKRVVRDMHCAGITVAYGLTEASPVITQTALEDPLELRVSTVGKPLPHTEVKIASLVDGTPVQCGNEGELCTRGYLVMKEYYDDRKATEQAIDSEGWLHTGDLATMDEEGYVRITGRIKDIIIRGGENIYPGEIEEFIRTCKDVIDIQVFGIPSRKYGEQVVAWVKLRPGSSLSSEHIRQFCKGNIAHYKIPRYVVIVDEFPMTVTGKIKKFEMRAMTTALLDPAEGVNKTV